MVDHMVVKLGKYLRILGYDAEWDLSVRTHEMIDRANAEGRFFLTRNTRINEEYPHPVQVIHLESADPVEQLRQVVSEKELDPESYLFSKCIKCNLKLDTLPDKTEIEEFVHPNVFKRHETFYRCPSCGTVFWKGSHVKNTMKKLQ